MKKVTLNLLSVIIVFALFAACSGEPKKEQKKEEIVVDDAVKKLIYPIPTPFEVTQMLKKSGVAFSQDLTNSPDKVAQYFTEKSKALNLGIYGADLSYSTTYNNTQETRKYLNVSKKLTEDLGLGTVIDENFIKRVEANIENEDSLYKIVTESYYKTFNQLSNSNKGAIAVMVLAGGWIESMYLTCQMAYIAKDKKGIIKELAQQKVTASTIYPLLINYKDNPDVSELLNDITKIKNIFSALKEVNDQIVMDEAQFNELAKLVEEIRTKIVALT